MRRLVGVGQRRGEAPVALLVDRGGGDRPPVAAAQRVVEHDDAAIGEVVERPDETRLSRPAVDDDQRELAADRVDLVDVRREVEPPVALLGRADHRRRRRHRLDDLEGGVGMVGEAFLDHLAEPAVVFHRVHLTHPSRQPQGARAGSPLEGAHRGRVAPAGQPRLDSVDGVVGPPRHVERGDAQRVVRPGQAVRPVPQPVLATRRIVGQQPDPLEAAPGGLRARRVHLLRRCQRTRHVAILLPIHGGPGRPRRCSGAVLSAS